MQRSNSSRPKPEATGVESECRRPGSLANGGDQVQNFALFPLFPLPSLTAAPLSVSADGYAEVAEKIPKAALPFIMRLTS